MNRTVAIIIAALVLASAGWWGWTRPDLLPGSGAETDTPAPARPAPRPEEAAPPAIAPEAAPTAAPRIGFRNNSPTSVPQKPPPTAPAAVRFMA